MITVEFVGGPLCGEVRAMPGTRPPPGLYIPKATLLSTASLWKGEYEAGYGYGEIRYILHGYSTRKLAYIYLHEPIMDYVNEEEDDEWSH